MAVKETNMIIRTTISKELYSKVKEIMDGEERSLQYCVTKALEKFVADNQKK